MQCSVCGSQDTTFKEGISKTGKNAGQPWKAYDCNEKECKNENGYPSRTFVPMPRVGFKPKPGQKPTGNSDSNALILKKLDLIIKALKITETENDDPPF